MPEPAREFLPTYTFINTIIWNAYVILRLSLEFVASNAPLVLLVSITCMMGVEHFTLAFAEQPLSCSLDDYRPFVHKLCVAHAPWVKSRLPVMQICLHRKTASVTRLNSNHRHLTVGSRSLCSTWTQQSVQSCCSRSGMHSSVDVQYIIYMQWYALLAWSTLLLWLAYMGFHARSIMFHANVWSMCSWRHAWAHQICTMLIPSLICQLCIATTRCTTKQASV